MVMNDRLTTFTPCQLALPFMGYDYFQFGPSKFKVKVMGVVKGKGHIVGLLSYLFASFAFHINQTNDS